MTKADDEDKERSFTVLATSQKIEHLGEQGYLIGEAPFSFFPSYRRTAWSTHCKTRPMPKRESFLELEAISSRDQPRPTYGI